MNTSVAVAAEPGMDRPVLTLVFVVVALWGAGMTILAANGLMLPAGDGPPVPILIAILVPVLGFVALYQAVPRCRDFVLNLDLRLITAFQSWRILGGMFLAFYAYDLLPGLFAFPAGMGDAAVGIAAPFVVLALIRDPAFATSGRFVAFHLLGLLDFVVAVGSGSLIPIAGDMLGATIPMTPMNTLPLVMTPGFLVPLFIILHLIALIQSRQLKQEAA